MTAKEYMLQVQKAEHELVAISEQRRHFQELATSISVNLTGMPGKRGASSRVETGAIGLYDIAEMYKAKEKQYVAMVKHAEELINKIEQDNFKTVLRLKYLSGASWKTIRDKMNYKDEKSVFHCHGYALKALQEVMQ